MCSITLFTVIIVFLILFLIAQSRTFTLGQIVQTQARQVSQLDMQQQQSI